MLWIYSLVTWDKDFISEMILDPMWESTCKRVDRCSVRTEM